MLPVLLGGYLPWPRFLEKLFRNTDGFVYEPLDPNSLLLRRNLFTYSEFPNGVTDAPTRSGLLSATTLTGYAGALAFGYDGATATYAYKTNVTTVIGQTYTASALVEMTDGLAPAFGNSNYSHVSNDFALVASNNIPPQSPLSYIVTHVTGAVYRVSTTVVAGVASSDNGVLKYATNSARTFKVTGYQIELGSLTDYQPVTDWTTEYTAAVGSLVGQWQESTGITPVMVTETAAGLMKDSSRGFVVGNHAIQATSAARPVESQRYNLISSTHTYAVAPWVKRGVVAVGAAAPDGTGQLISGIGAGGVDDIFQSTTGLAGVRYEPYMLIWPVTLTGLLRLESPAGSAGGRWTIDLAALSPGGWNVITRSHPAVTVGTEFVGATIGHFMWAASGGPLSFYAKNPQVLLLSDTLFSIPPYQEVRSATDYATDGFPAYERFDGVDDNRTCASGGGSTTGFFWCGVVTVLGGAGTEREIWSDIGVNTGISARINTNNALSFNTGNGAAYVTTVTANNSVAVGDTHVLSIWYDGTNGYVQIDNQTPIAGAAVALSAGATGFTEGKLHTSAAQFWNGRMYGRVYCKNYSPSANLRERIKRRLAEQAGCLHLLS